MFLKQMYMKKQTDPPNKNLFILLIWRNQYIFHLVRERRDRGDFGESSVRDVAVIEISCHKPVFSECPGSSPGGPCDSVCLICVPDNGTYCQMLSFLFFLILR